MIFINLNYAIFRSEPIMTIPDLAQIGSHNKREKKAYQSNKDIKIELSKNNIELVPLDMKYTKGFDKLTKEYKKEQVLHSVIHLDEKTPHIHCVVVPLVRKFDNRTKTERYTISKKQYIKDNIHLSELQDKYHKRLIDKVYDLERGIKGSNRKHIKIKDYKNINRKLEQNLNTRNVRLDKAMHKLEEQMKTSKTIPFDKKHIVVEKDTFDTMNMVIMETKKVKELQPKIEQIFNDIDSYVNSYNSLDKENKKYQREIKSLKTRNSNLIIENNKLRDYINAILKAIKTFFRKLLQLVMKLQKRLLQAK